MRFFQIPIYGKTQMLPNGLVDDKCRIVKPREELGRKKREVSMMGLTEVALDTNRREAPFAFHIFWFTPPRAVADQSARRIWSSVRATGRGKDGTSVAKKASNVSFSLRKIHTFNFATSRVCPCLFA